MLINYVIMNIGALECDRLIDRCDQMLEPAWITPAVGVCIPWPPPCVGRCGFRTEEPSSGSRSGLHRSSSPWVWSQLTGHCWGGCTCRRPACPGSIIPNPWLTYPTFPRCFRRAPIHTTRAQSASSPAPASHHRRGSTKTGTAHWGVTSPPQCSPWPPCSPWTPAPTGAQPQPSSADDLQ